MKEFILSYGDKLSLIINKLKYYEDEYNIIFEKDNLGQNVAFLTNENKLKIRNEMFSFIVELFEFDNHPKIVNTDEYKNLSCYNVDFENDFDNSEFYTASKDYHNNYTLLYSRKYYKGINTFSNGIYASTNKDDTINYAKKVKNESLYFKNDIILPEENKNFDYFILPFKLPNAKIIKDTDLLYILTNIFYDNKVTNKNNPFEKQLLNFVNKIKDSELKFKLAFLFENDIGKLGILLGYDAVYITRDSETYIQVLNRLKMTVSFPNYEKTEYEFLVKSNPFNK